MLRSIERYLFEMAMKLNNYRMRKLNRKRVFIAALLLQADCDRLRLAPR